LGYTAFKLCFEFDFRHYTKEYGLEYCVYPTFWSALTAHFTHLKNVGQKLYVPSLQTVG
jgi:hypothetical protein